MKKNLKLFVFATSMLLFNTAAVVAQISEVFAGGEITYEYIEEPNFECGDPMAYDITFKFYRDCGTASNPFSDVKVVTIWSQDLNLQFDVTLTEVEERGQIENRCINTFAGSICTEGRWYSTSSPAIIPAPATDWVIHYGDRDNGVIAQSPENYNIEGGQTFFVRTTLNNTCDTAATRPNVKGLPAPNVAKANSLYNNQSARWLTEDVVETFCSGKSYNYRFPVIDEDTIFVLKDINNPSAGFDTLYDNLTFQLKRTLKGNRRTTTYEPGYSGFNPFPTSPNGRIIPTDVEDGQFTFTPQLPLGIDEFIAVFTVEVTEWRDGYFLDTLCLSQNGVCSTNPADSTDVLLTKRVAVNRTYRQMRFVISNDCDKNLPDFEGVENNYNATEDAWEFDCAVTELDFRMTEPMLCNDVRIDPKWLSMYRGKPGSPIDDNGIGIDSIQPLNCNNLGEFTRFRVYLFKPIGPGNYTLFPKPNKSKTGIFNRCGFELEEGSVEIPIVINTAYTYNFLTNEIPIKICYPGEDQILDALQGQEKLADVAYLYTWKYTPNGSPALPPLDVDTRIFRPNNTFKLEAAIDPIDGDTLFPDGEWTVGLGLDFSYTYNNQRIEAICYDEDRILVEFFETPVLEIPDYDLCNDEPWPVIDIDSMTNKHDAISYRWEYFDQFGEWTPTGGASNSKAKNDSLITEATAFGLGRTFDFNVFVQLPQCSRRDTFSVRKSFVDVELEPGNDSIICPGEQFMLRNTETYLIPDSMTYEWKLNGEIIPGADSNSLMITERGLYRLIVTKNTENSMCSDSDAVFINVADSLFPPEPICTQVTFKDGDIEQTFFVPGMEGAEGFQVREVDPLNNRGEWEEPNQGVFDHLLRGKQLRLEARAVNTEVEEDAPCRYGPVGIAEACNAIVKPVNVFTPNGDGVNEFLRFDLLEVFPGSPLLIYNRWGELIYESDSYQNDWDGDNHKDGTYFYVLDINDESQGVLKGTFTILR